MTRPKAMALFSAALLLGCRAFARDGAEVSSGTAVQRFRESPLTLNIEKDGYGSRVGLDYSLRWDFSDLKKLRPGLRTLVDGIAAVGRWDITENTRVRYYGFTANPWRMIIAREKAPAAHGGPASGGIVAGRERHRKRVRLSLSPLVDEVTRDFDENLRNALLDGAFSASPEWQRASRREKKGFFQDVLSLDIWAAPGLDEAGKGLEYISQ